MYKQYKSKKDSKPLSWAQILSNNNIFIETKDKPDFLAFINIGQIDSLINYFKQTLLKLNKNNHTKISKTLHLSEISEVLGKKIASVSEITRQDYQKIMKNPVYNFHYCLEHFSLKSRDTVIQSNNDFELGYQESPVCDENKMYYLKFYDFLMLDYDDMLLDDIKSILNKTCVSEDHLFYIFKTYRGYHIYEMSRRRNHAELTTAYFMKNLKCDLWYILFSHKNGFKIRLTPKKNRCEDKLEEFVETWGCASPHPVCLFYLETLKHYQEMPEIPEIY